MDGFPKLFLIGRKAIAEQPDKVKEALRSSAIVGTFVACEIDSKLAEVLGVQVMGFQNPFVLIADFPFELAFIDDRGQLVPAALPETLPAQTAPEGLTNESANNHNPVGS